MLNSLIIAITFITIIPLPSRLIPEWNSRNLRYFCLMLPVTGLIFSLLWLICFQVLAMIPTVSSILRGFMMMTFTLLLTGGLHLDGLMDTCDAIFSHRDRETRLKILSDTHAGSFAVMGCMVIMIAKTLLFSELFRLSANISSIALIPIYSRLGMGVLLNNLPFAKSDGLAVMLGSSR
ncbi:MAG: adenosylcobinamide-GDP ribazoletransferase, partial [Synergistaceae bacterium]|nr:adenosylcobinamide-GDP ribazoletransferase [Synergistaceae bacterium]